MLCRRVSRVHGGPGPPVSRAYGTCCVLGRVLDALPSLRSKRPDAAARCMQELNAADGAAGPGSCAAVFAPVGESAPMATRPQQNAMNMAGPRHSPHTPRVLSRACASAGLNTGFGLLPSPLT